MAMTQDRVLVKGMECGQHGAVSFRIGWETYRAAVFLVDPKDDTGFRGGKRAGARLYACTHATRTVMPSCSFIAFSRHNVNFDEHDLRFFERKYVRSD